MRKWLCISMILFATLYTDTSNAQTNNMVYLYGSDGANYEKQLDHTLDLVGTIAPDYFHINQDGNLESHIDVDFVKTAKQKGYTVTPFISNDWDPSVAVKAIQNQDKLVEDLAAAVSAGNLDGVDVDIENLSGNQRDLHTAFIKKLSDKLHSMGKIVSIAVPPTTGETSTGWVGSYDYEAIGKMVDKVFIMGYDYSYPGGPKGPVAPLAWVDQSLSYMVTKIAPEKMILGIPFYGRYWTNQKKGIGIYYTKALDLIRQNNANVRYDSSSSSIVADLTDPSGAPMEIWLDNAKTLQQKIQLVDKYHLAGWGGWHLGQEDPQLWEYISDNIPYYWDLSGHWAQNQIIDLSKKQLFSGYESGAFLPDKNISREEVAALIQRLKKFANPTPFSFQDEPSTAWSYSAVSAMASASIMNGYPDGTFKPTLPITRAEFSSVLARCYPTLGTTQTPISLSDIHSHWAEKDIITLAGAGIVGGYEDGTFRPDRPVTRAEAASMIWRILKSTNSL